MVLTTSAMPQALPLETGAPVSQAMQPVLTTRAAGAAVAWHDPTRPDVATFSASTLVPTLVCGWLAHPAATGAPVAQMAATVGGDVSPQAMDQRCTLAPAARLRTVLLSRVPQGIARNPGAMPIRQRFAGVRVHARTTITRPARLAEHAQGGGGQTETTTAAARTCGRPRDLRTGADTHLNRADGRAGPRVRGDQRVPRTHAPLPPGAVRLADRGCLDRAVLAARDAGGVSDRSKRTARITLCAGTQPPVALLVCIHALAPCAP
jgi:hypothetical protein